MAKKASKKQSKTGGRNKKVKLTDLQASRGGSVKGGATSIKSSTIYYK